MNQPVFASTLRGYDRQQVDDYVATLLSYLDEAARRLEDLQARPTAEAALGALTDSLTALLGSAEIGARERLSQAHAAVAAAERDLEAIERHRAELQAGIERLQAEHRSMPVGWA